MTTSSPSTSSTEHGTLHGTALSVSLTVKDLEQSLAWYEEVAGLSVDQKYEREGKVTAIALRAGTVRVLINQDDGGRGWDRVKGEGFSLQITTEQNLDELASGIKTRGGALASEPADMPWGVRMFRLVDPDGYRWTISSPKFA